MPNGQVEINLKIKIKIGIKNQLFDEFYTKEREIHRYRLLILVNIYIGIL